MAVLREQAADGFAAGGGNFGEEKQEFIEQSLAGAIREDAAFAKAAP